MPDHQKALNKLIIVAALGYFVDIYDLLLFGVERVESLTQIFQEKMPGVRKETLGTLIDVYGKQLLNWQMLGMVFGGIFWGILGDKKGRLSVLFGSILTYSVANILNAMVHDTDSYAILRFVSGFGLAGELGAGITLVSETMSREKRGIGTMIVATVGVFGAVVAGFMGHIITDWRTSFYIGGGMGLVLLILRIGVFESGMFQSVKEENVSRGNFFQLFTSRKRFFKYFNVIMVTVPVWYVMGSLVLFSPELSKLMGLHDASGNSVIKSGLAIMYAYAGITLGDIVSGLLSQKLKSRKKTFLLFLLLTIVSVVLYFTIAARSEVMFYSVIAFMGFATGYWAVFISTASELFGTNIRATATTTAPNFVRGSTNLIYLLTGLLMSFVGNKIEATILTGVILMGIAFVSLYYLEETFGKELNYVE